MNTDAPNKPDAENPAMALRFPVEDQWRRVTDLQRSAECGSRDTKVVEPLNNTNYRNRFIRDIRAIRG